MFIRPMNYSGVYSYDYIKSRIAVKGEQIFCTRLDNEMIAIVAPDSLENPQPLIVFDEKVEIPLWKQSMEMQMWHTHKTHTSQRTSRQVRWLSEAQINPSMRFVVYEFVHN